MRIGFVHAAMLLLERVRSEMGSQQPHVDCFHILNEALMQDLERGEHRSLVYRHTVLQLVLAADTLTDLVVLTCPPLAPAADIARHVCTVPIIKIDDAMAAEAVRTGRRISVLCTDTVTPGPMAGLLRQHAAAQGREVLVETVVRPEAHTALYAGDIDRHDSIMFEAARQAAVRADLLVLAQASLGHLQSPLQALGRPVLLSLPLLMADIARRLAPLQPSG